MKNAAWVDGQWMWRSGRWVWHPGDWVDLKPGQIYELPTLLYLSDGFLHWFVGGFRDALGEKERAEHGTETDEPSPPNP